MQLLPRERQAPASEPVPMAEPSRYCWPATPEMALVLSGLSVMGFCGMAMAKRVKLSEPRAPAGAGTERRLLTPSNRTAGKPLSTEGFQMCCLERTDCVALLLLPEKSRQTLTWLSEFLTTPRLAMSQRVSP